jgi:hypothetical protein
VTACTAKAEDVPLRCVDAADPAELAAWPRELYHAGGKVYRPITNVVMQQDTRPVLQEQPDLDGVPQPPKEVQEPYERPETILDEAATLAAGPATPPSTIAHVHRRCSICGATWPEALPAAA